MRMDRRVSVKDARRDRPEKSIHLHGESSQLDERGKEKGWRNNRLNSVTWKRERESSSDGGKATMTPVPCQEQEQGGMNYAPRIFR